MNENVQFFLDEIDRRSEGGMRDTRKIALALIVAQITDMGDILREIRELLKQQEKQ